VRRSMAVSRSGNFAAHGTVRKSELRCRGYLRSRTTIFPLRQPVPLFRSQPRQPDWQRSMEERSR
jgi:hypothetical protein